MKAELTNRERELIQESLAMYKDIFRDDDATSAEVALKSEMETLADVIFDNVCGCSYEDKDGRKYTRETIAYIRKLQTILVKLELNANNN